MVKEEEDSDSQNSDSLESSEEFDSELSNTDFSDFSN